MIVLGLAAATSINEDVATAIVSVCLIFFGAFIAKAFDFQKQ